MRARQLVNGTFDPSVPLPIIQRLQAADFRRMLQITYNLWAFRSIPTLRQCDSKQLVSKSATVILSRLKSITP
jgi:hypothetical protein